MFLTNSTNNNLFITKSFNARQPISKKNSLLEQVFSRKLQFIKFLSQQPKWQLWISCKSILDHKILTDAGLDTRKIVALSKINEDKIIDIIEKALLAKTSSYIIANIPHILQITEKKRLQNAVKISGTHLFLINDEYDYFDEFMTMSLSE